MSSTKDNFRKHYYSVLNDREWMPLISGRFFINLKVYRYLKTFIIMPVETRFLCRISRGDFLTVLNNKEDVIITLTSDSKEYDVCLDIPTAIKLSKTIRTHINLVKSNKDE